MKHLLALLILITSCITTTCIAQEDEGRCKPVSFGVRGGLNVTNNVPMSLLSDQNNKWLCAFNLGVSCDIRKSETFAGRTGLYYSAKGYKNTGTPYTHLNYMEMPMLAVFSKQLGKNVSLETQAGVYIAYGICGETKTPTSIGYRYVSSFHGDNSLVETYKRFDWGWNVGAGINVNRVYIGCAYEVSALFGKHNTNHCIMANVGYRIL